MGIKYVIIYQMYEIKYKINIDDIPLADQLIGK